MKTIQMEIDDSLLAEVERATKASGATPSEFICNAIRLVLREEAIPLLEKKHGEGYATKPVVKDEFDAWETEQVWGNE
ncbi:MAG: metal-responsive CopG/Arc/MetJ family transcriptional regulator [Candidatus Latescibacterota bacterium]|jgi:metal-responsive CopG/Arc/MetJ family transcriptional regulator